MMKIYTSLFIIFLKVVNSCKVLSLSGGGVFGAYEIGLVSNLLEKNKTWDLITGISSGSINAAYLSTIVSGEEKYNIKEFKKFWTNLENKDIYNSIYFLNGLSLYDNSPMKKKLKEVYEYKKAIRPVLLGSTSLKTGNKKVFNEDDINILGFTDIIMSSTAIPILFPPYRFNNDLFIDGGLTSNILLNEGINFCLKKYPNSQIFIDVIVCGKKINLDNSIINEYNIKKILDRIIKIIYYQLEYNELEHPVLEKNLFITVYEQEYEESIGILDFSKTENLWNEGYDFSNVNIYYVNSTKLSSVKKYLKNI